MTVAGVDCLMKEKTRNTKKSKNKIFSATIFCMYLSVTV